MTLHSLAQIDGLFENAHPNPLLSNNSFESSNPRPTQSNKRPLFLKFFACLKNSHGKMLCKVLNTAMRRPKAIRQNKTLITLYIFFANTNKP